MSNYDLTKIINLNNNTSIFYVKKISVILKKYVKFLLQYVRLLILEV